jgi:hypothetical protein
MKLWRGTEVATLRSVLHRRTLPTKLNNELFKIMERIFGETGFIVSLYNYNIYLRISLGLFAEVTATDAVD